MPGDNDLDIIDAALTADDTDYGDKPQQQQTGDDGAQPELLDKVELPGQQQQPDTQQQPNVPGRVPNTPAQQPNGQQQQKQELKRVGSQFADGKGNIVDKDGKVLARAGEGARLWQEASRANARATNFERQLNDANRQLAEQRQIIQAAREIAEMPQKMGISREDYNEGIALMAKWRADPVGVAREIVARTLTFGHNVSDILGKSAGDALEMKAITNLVRQTTAPIQQQQQQEAAARQQNETAQRAYNTFVANHEFAEVHADAIAALMGKGIAPETAYYQIEAFALRNGLDFSQPLGPQVDAARSNNGQRPPQPQVQQQQRAIPNGGRGSERQVATEPAMADANDDWGSILNSVMRSTQ